MSGPPRIPKVLLEARGSTLASSREDMPTIEGRPEPPKWMDKAARPYWKWIVCNAHPSVLVKCDAGHIQLVAESWLLYEQACAEIAKGGLFSVSRTGAEYQRPVVGIRNNAWKQVVAGLAKLGMNPSDRSNVAAAPEANKGRIGKFVAVA